MRVLLRAKIGNFQHIKNGRCHMSPAVLNTFLNMYLFYVHRLICGIQKGSG